MWQDCKNYQGIQLEPVKYPTGTRKLEIII